MAQLLTYAGSAVAFVARPFGGAVFGHFRTRLRYSGASVSYNLGGAFAPILASSLLIVAGGLWAISLYIALMDLLSFACVRSPPGRTSPRCSEEERDLLAEEGVVPE